MKSTLIVITIALAFTTGYTDIGIGVKGGLSLFKAHDNQSFNAFDEFRTAPDFSAFCELGINKFLFHNIQFTYYQAGGKSTVQVYDVLGNPGEEGWYAIKLDYIGIGYGLEFKVQLLNILPYITAGVSLDYLVHEKEEMTFGKTIEECHFFDNSGLKKFNVRPFLTGGLEYKIFRIAILAEYTFSYNVLPYYEHEKSATNMGIKYKTFGHFINLGCKIYL